MLATQHPMTDSDDNRLARNLHDSLSQSLFSASLIAERLPSMAEIDQDEARKGLQALKQLMRSALTELRALRIELRPHEFAEAPLHTSLYLLASAFASRQNIPIVMLLDQAPRLPLDVQRSIYRVVQEALMNVVSHAHATAIGIYMTVTPPPGSAADGWQGTIRAEVYDNGHGFVSGPPEPHRLGIGIMRECATAVGAQLTIVSAPDQGTSVVLVWQGGSGE